MPFVGIIKLHAGLLLWLLFGKKDGLVDESLFFTKAMLWGGRTAPSVDRHAAKFTWLPQISLFLFFSLKYSANSSLEVMVPGNSRRKLPSLSAPPTRSSTDTSLNVVAPWMRWTAMTSASVLKTTWINWAFHGFVRREITYAQSTYNVT